MAPLAVLGSFGMAEILAILAIVVFLFGARRIPEIAKGLGEGIRGFRTSLKGEESGSSSSTPEDEASKTPKS